MSVDEHSFEPDWTENDEAREILDEVEFDTELGLELAKDAQLLAEGEMTEDEFYDKHNETVENEFGIDARPTDPNHVEPLPEEVVEKAVSGEDIGDVPPASQRWNEEVGNGGGDGGDGDGFGEDDDGTSRRSFLKSGGALAAGVAAATWSNRNPAGVWDDEEEEEELVSTGEDDGVQMGMVIDNDACVGDLVCVDACERENQSPEGALWQFVIQFEEEHHNDPNFLVRPCQHCSNPPCVSVCPVRARHKREEDGLVLTDYDICIGCRYCQVACPYGVNYFQWGEPTEELQEAEETGEFEAGLAGQTFPKDDNNGRNVAGAPGEQGVMTKCTFCVHRQDSGDPELESTTACEESCPQNAIRFGDLNDPESDPRQYLQEKIDEFDDMPTEYDGDADYNRVSTWKFQEEKGTRPNVIYIGNEPSETAEWASDGTLEGSALAQKYDDLGLERSRPGFSRPEGY